LTGRGVSPRRWRIAGPALALVALLAVAILLRVLYLDADTPHWVGAWWLNDEGWWVRNARNRALFGRWSFGDFSQALFGAPVFTFANYVAFRFLGVGLGQARVVSAGAGAGTLLVLFAWVRPFRGLRVALLTAAALGFQFFFFLNNRLATPESLATFWLTVAALAWSRGRRTSLAYGVSGLAALLAIGSKVTAAFFLAVPLLAMLFERLASSQKERARARRPLVLFYLTVGIPLVTALLVLRPLWPRLLRLFVAVATTQGSVSTLRLPTYALGFLMLPAFADMPIVWTLCVLRLAQRGKALWEGPGDALERFAVAWLLAGGFALAWLDHFWRHAAVLLPPIVVLAVSCLCDLADTAGAAYLPPAGGEAAGHQWPVSPLPAQGEEAMFTPPMRGALRLPRRGERAPVFEAAASPPGVAMLLVLYPPLLILAQGLYPPLEMFTRSLSVGRRPGLGPTTQGTIAFLLAALLLLGAARQWRCSVRGRAALAAIAEVYPGAAALWAVLAAGLSVISYRLGWVMAVQGRLLPVLSPGAVALLLILPAGFLLLRWDKARIRVLFRRPEMWIVAFLLVNGVPAVRYFSGATFTVAETGRDLADYVGAGTVVTGGRADTLLLPTEARVIWEPARERGWSAYAGPPPSLTLLVRVPWNDEPLPEVAPDQRLAHFVVWPMTGVSGVESTVDLVHGRQSR